MVFRLRGGAELRVEVTGDWLNATRMERDILTAIANALEELAPGGSEVLDSAPVEERSDA